MLGGCGQRGTSRSPLSVSRGRRDWCLGHEMAGSVENGRLSTQVCRPNENAIDDIFEVCYLTRVTLVLLNGKGERADLIYP